MHATMNGRDFKQSLSHVRRFAGKSHSMPVLGSVLLEPREGGVRFLATDLECAAAYDAPAAGSLSGPLAVPVARLWAIARTVKARDAVTLAVEPDESLRVSIGGREYRLEGVSAEEYPTVPLERPEGAKVARFATAELGRLFGVAYASSRDETRYNLNGVLVEALSDRVRAVATDGHRLALEDVAPPKGAPAVPHRRKPADKSGHRPYVWTAQSRGDGPSILVPSALAFALRKVAGARRPLAETAEWRVSGAPGAGCVTVRMGPLTLSARVMDADFPHYPQVLPKGGAAWTVDRERLAEVAKAAEACAPDRSRALKLRANGALEVSTSNPDAGEYHETLEADADAPGADVELGVNGRYLRECLAHLPGERVRMALRDPDAPIRFEAEGHPDGMAVVMPMRL